MEVGEIIGHLQALRDTLEGAGVRGLAVFGSRARGDYGPESDLDVLVDVPRGSKFSLLDLVGVEHAIGDRIGIPANAFMRRSLEPNFLSSIASDVIEIF